MTDWRLRGQEEYLKGVSFSLQRYKKYREGWEHDHCDFCFAKFSEQQGDLNVGYATSNSDNWVCETCFQDFKSMFQWIVIGKGEGANASCENTSYEP